MRFTPWLTLLAACGEFIPPAPFELSVHTCPGARVDDLFRDDDGTLWLGCGEASEGTGLHRSDDRGETWEAVEGFDTFRVSSISRRGQGPLYVAGTEVGGPDRVRAIDGQGGPIESVFVAQNQIWNTFHVGTFIQQESGMAIAESLTGSGMAVRQTALGNWTDASPWSDGSYQMLDALDADGRILGVGSTIIQPPTLFVQEQGAYFEAIPLDESYTGELWTIDQAQGVTAVGGVDQDADVGVLFVTEGLPSEPGNWIPYRVDTGQATWIRDVCVAGRHLVAVGSFTVLDSGLAYESIDAGASWRPLELPDDTPSLWSCWLDDEALWMAGGNGFIARRDL